MTQKNDNMKEICKNCGKELGFNRNEYYHETTVTTECDNPEPDFVENSRRTPDGMKNEDLKKIGESLIKIKIEMQSDWGRLKIQQALDHLERQTSQSNRSVKK